MSSTLHHSDPLPTVAIVAGGTGGHIFPGLAVAAKFQTLNISVNWFGTRDRMEATLVPARGIPIRFIQVTGLRGKGRLALLKAPWMLLQAIKQAIVELRRLRPKVVLSFGGFVTGPVGIAAWLLRIPLVIHEQNAIAGTTNQILARIATQVLASYPNSFKVKKSVLITGNPIPQSFITGRSSQQRAANEVGKHAPLKILVLGGSQGAKMLNQQLPLAFDYAAREVPLLVKHQAGAKMLQIAQNSYAETKVDAEVLPFIEDMLSVYQWADLIICRAGALTLAEITAVGVASILIPFPLAIDDHQTLNARHMVVHGASDIIAQSDFSAQRLGLRLIQLAQDRQQLKQMAQKARLLANLDATDKVVQACLNIADISNSHLSLQNKQALTD